MNKLSILDELKKGGYEASLITTFNAYLPFYEDVVLRKLISSGVRHNVLLIDSGQCALSIAQHPPRLAGRHYSLIPMISSGVFHPKVILMVGKNKGILIIGSHNLTLSGFGFNREITNYIRLENREDNEAITLLTDAWRQIQGWINLQKNYLPDHIIEMVKKIEGFAPWIKRGNKQDIDGFSVISTQYKEPPLWDKLKHLIGGKVRQVIVTGAFFDSQLEFVRRVKEDLQPENIFIGIEPSTVQLPGGLKNIKGVTVVNCSKLGAKENSDKENVGYLHAKSIVIITEDGKVYLATGSANPSAPAWFADDSSANTEIMMLRSDNNTAKDMKEIGLSLIPSLPKLTDQDWELTETNWQSGKKDRKRESTKIGIAIASDECISFKLDISPIEPSIDCEVLDLNKNLLTTIKADLIDGMYKLTFSDSLRNQASYLQIYLESGATLSYIVHHENMIKAQAQTGTQRRFREALDSLNTDTPDLTTLISCIDKIIFRKETDENKSDNKIKVRKSGKENNESETEVNHPLSIDISETQKTRKKYRLRLSDNLTYLLDVLIYHLRLDVDIEKPMESLDEKGRTEEEQIGAEDDEEHVIEDLSQEKIALKTLAFCHSKIHTLIGRMINQLDNLKKRKVTFDDAVVRLTGVLAFLRHLRGFDGKVFWIRQGQSSFPLKERRRLFDAVIRNLFEGDNSILFPNEDNKYIIESDEISRLKGLIVWLAWDCGLTLKTEKKFIETPEDRDIRIINYAKMIALAQLINNDNLVINEANQSIAPLCSSDMDWFSWVLATNDKMTKFNSNSGSYRDGSKAKIGDLAFHPKVPDIGFRVILKRTEKILRFVCFDQNKDMSYQKTFIRVAPFNEIV